MAADQWVWCWFEHQNLYDKPCRNGVVCGNCSTGISVRMLGWEHIDLTGYVVCIPRCCDFIR